MGVSNVAQRRIESSGFKAETEDHTVTAKITNKDTGEQWSALRLGFSYTGETTDNQGHAAILYAQKQDDIVSVRGITQHEGEPVTVHEMTGSAHGGSARAFATADDGNASTYTVPVVGGDK